MDGADIHDDASSYHCIADTANSLFILTVTYGQTYTA